SVYKDGDAEVISDINVTPLVDVVLVLLVIFMVTAPIVAARGIVVNAPTTVSGNTVSTPVQVTLTADGKLYVKGTEQRDYDTARAELQRLVAADPALKAVIAADAAVPHGEVMQAIDAVKRAGIQKFALASKKPPEDDRE
ncbi:MAG TPA: biopolymer transporter ExbD, partial [Kofleriaceae bacterium]|nr:biopolymer transporter ExbD [Kofleriaceae bacterium]